MPYNSKQMKLVRRFPSTVLITSLATTFIIISTFVVQFFFFNFLNEVNKLIDISTARINNFEHVIKIAKLLQTESEIGNATPFFVKRAQHKITLGLEAEKDMKKQLDELIPNLYKWILIDYLFENNMPLIQSLDVQKATEALERISTASNEQLESGFLNWALMDSIDMSTSNLIKNMEAASIELRRIAMTMSNKLLPFFLLTSFLSVLSIWLIWLFFHRPSILAIEAQRAEQDLITRILPVRIWKVNKNGFVAFSNTGLFNKVNIFELGNRPNDLAGIRLFDSLRYQVNETFSGGKIEDTFQIKNVDQSVSIFKINTRHQMTTVEASEFALIVHHDITELSELQDRVAMSQKIEAVGLLTGTIAHDFNNILGALLASAELIELGNLDPDLLKTIFSAIESGKNTTDRMLNISRKHDTVTQIVDLRDTLKDIQEFTKRTLPANVKINVDFGSVPLLVKIDKSLWRTSLLNLLLNSVDAIKSNGKINISLSSLMKDKKFARIIIEDNGVGMDEDTLNKCKTPFFTTKLGAGGSGLGLSSVQSFVERSKGDLKVESTLGIGSKVTIDFPVVKGSNKKKIKVNVPKTSKISKKIRILIVEDDEYLNPIISKMVTALGYEHRIVKTGDEALNVFKENSEFDLILTDIVLPGELSGPEFVKQALSVSDRPKVIFMSGYTDAYLSRHITNEEAVTLLQKPFKMIELKRVILSCF